MIENMAFHEKIYEKYYTEGKERSQLDFVKIENLSLMWFFIFCNKSKF